MNAPERKTRCSASAWTNGIYGSSPCSKAAKVERDGKSYCTIHDPERRKAKDAEREERWKRESSMDRAADRIHNCERDVIAAVLAGTPLDAPRKALLDAIAARDTLMSCVPPAGGVAYLEEGPQ